MKSTQPTPLSFQAYLYRNMCSHIVYKISLHSAEREVYRSIVY